MTTTPPIKPWSSRDPCWTCQHFGGLTAGETTTTIKCVKHDVVRPGDQGCATHELSTKAPMRMLVCGGRDYVDRRAAFEALDRVLTKRRIVLVIHGAARGGDTLADEWAQARKIERLPCPADWKRWGKMAGPIRNKEMLAHQPDGVVALPGGRGTEDMVMQALAAGLPVWRPLG